MPSFLQRARAALGVFTRGIAAVAELAGTAYQAAGKGTGALKFWRPRLASPDAEYLKDRATIVARARDLHRNDTTVASATRRRVSAAVGNGWRLSARIDGEALGFTEEETAALNRAIERAWRGYAHGHRFEIDAQRQLTFGGLLRTLARTWFVEGEAFAHVSWVSGDPSSTWKTRLDLIDGDRVSNPNNGQDTDTLRAGIELDPDTRAPIAYFVRSRHPHDIGFATAQATWRRIPRWTPWGRPQFLHVVDRERAGQTRGVSQLVSALKALKSLDRFSEATLENAILNALLLGAVKSNGGPQAVSESLSVEDLAQMEEARTDTYGGRTVDLSAGVTLPVLPHGDELQMFTQARDVGSFEAYTRTILRRIAAALGVTYEELAMDYSTTNYSSARAAMIHAWAETLALQTLLRDLLVQPFYVGWLEEAIETERLALPLSAPDFWKNLDAYTRCRWIAPGRGYIDPTKEIDAAVSRINAGLSTLEDECAEQGKDWEEIAEQKKREADKLASLGVSLPDAAPKVNSVVTLDDPDARPDIPEAA